MLSILILSYTHQKGLCEKLHREKWGKSECPLVDYVYLKLSPTVHFEKNLDAKEDYITMTWQDGSKTKTKLK
jgi:hypothetical protein